ncbi:hypothetical protein MTBBW1_760055 [Desulfamplus magnetovallimortis]|uniref:Uncharacterized protein n=1 Tax=Desulfamplus magnetovallimortis TaxID=1246637 RepID=A0A1W1HJB4_9BACT|nr:hypothetical protein MTBBW1_760055 [Desulfamplus magnetovallimortis]
MAAIQPPPNIENCIHFHGKTIVTTKDQGVEILKAKGKIILCLTLNCIQLYVNILHAIFS